MKPIYAVRYHVEGYGPGRTSHSWGAILRFETVEAAPGPEGWLAVGHDDQGFFIDESDDDVCPPELHGARIDGPGRIIVNDKEE